MEEILLSRGYKAYLIEKDKQCFDDCVGNLIENYPYTTNKNVDVYVVYSDKQQVASIVVNNGTVVACRGPNNGAPRRTDIAYVQELIQKKNFDIDTSAPYICLLKQGGVYYDVFRLPKGFIVDGNINISGLGLYSLPDFSMVTVKGNFDCSDNNICSLAGAPRNIYGDFICANNKLKNLQYGPRYVSGNYDCHKNKLVCLIGAPGVIGGGFNCSYNKLSNLMNGPMLCGSNAKYKGQHLDVDCRYNNLVSLAGLSTLRSEDMDWLFEGNQLDERSIFPCWLIKYLEHVKGVSESVLKYWAFYGGGDSSLARVVPRKKKLIKETVVTLPESYIRNLRWK
ncbi:MAG: hypothetical protein MJ156_03175 [Alphaproteobacteria bacterium]|nr:hypothetical protein [Alphaproteobacteria bacterium]